MNNIASVTIFFLCFLLLTFALLGKAKAQEVEGPSYPQYDLWTDCCHNTQQFDSDAHTERDRAFREEHELQRRTRDQLIRRLPDFCIATPLAIDDRYVGCLIHFQPEPARVDEWK